MQILKPQLK